MSDQNTENGNNADEGNDDGKPGFRIILPFGLGWLRGDGGHLALLMPTVKYGLIVASGLYLILRIIQELRP